jgi:hypothetical protein
MAEPASTPPSGRNLAAWLGPLIAIAGFLSYYTISAQYPVLSDFPWLNLLILAGAMGLGVVAVRRARSGLGRAGSVAGLGLSTFLTGLLVFYCFFYSYGLPDAGRVADDGTKIPPISLASWDGKKIDIEAAAQGELILVFYRGYW